MAELLVAGGGVVPSSLGAYLRETLPDEYTVVSDPVVCRRELAAVVIGPCDLIVVEVAAGAAVEPGAHGTDQTAAEVVRAFLAEEFPTLRPHIYHLCVVLDRKAAFPTWRPIGHNAITSETAPDLAETIVGLPALTACGLADPASREELAVALRDRQIIPSQRTTQPFVFRSGGFLGADKPAWTIREAIRHMDRYPEDGVYHLMDHTLEEWLRAEGAPHLAALARRAADSCCDDHRRGLEAFLIGSGLVARPRLITWPRQLDLGYIVTGETGAALLRLRKGRGRGYLAGDLSASASYLSATPRTFSGARASAVVSVHTAGLLIQPTPYQGQIYIRSSAQVEPLPIPVRFQIMPMPAPISRYIGRPLIGLLTGGALGALVGGLWGLILFPGVKSLLDWTMFGPPLFWVLLITLLWAVLGAVRGLLQPLAWPVRYALLRWLFALGIWAAALGLFAAAAVWCWRQGLAGPVVAAATPLWIAGGYGVALAALPATLQEVLAARRPDHTVPESPWRQARRWLAWAGASAALLVSVFLSPAILRSAWERQEYRHVFPAVWGWVEGGWGRANLGADELLKQFYLYYYDRRAPSSPQPTSRSERASGTPGGR